MFSYLGYGLGLRAYYYQAILDALPKVDWFEIMTEDYLVPGGRPFYYLDQIRQHYPKLAMHGVSLSIGSMDPLNLDYLAQVKKLADVIAPQWISDHLCWNGVSGAHLHDLLPLPYTEEAIQHVVDRVVQVQDFLQRQIVLENVSSYVTYTDSQMSEWEFLTEVANRADCYILLDINNIYVSGFNHRFEPLDFINAIPVNRVQQFHLAGHERRSNIIIDTHDDPITDDVWKLYQHALKRFPRASTLIERDDNFPPLEELVDELNYARSFAKAAEAIPA